MNQKVVSVTQQQQQINHKIIKSNNSNSENINNNHLNNNSINLNGDQHKIIKSSVASTVTSLPVTSTTLISASNKQQKIIGNNLPDSSTVRQQTTCNSIKLSTTGSKVFSTGTDGGTNGGISSAPDARAKQVLKEAVDAVVNSFAKHTQGYGRGK